MSRILLVLIYLLLNASGILLGTLLEMVQVSIPFVVAYFLLIPFLTAVLLYPSRKQKHSFRNFYRARKTADAVLVACSFLFVVCYSNQPAGNALLQNRQAVFASSEATPVVSEKPGKPKIRIRLEKSSFSKKQWQQIKQNVKEIRKTLRKKTTAGQVFLIILTVLVALALQFLVAALACDLSCSGAEGLAWTVLLLGTALVTFLTVVVIRRIVRKPEPHPLRESN